MVEANYTVVGMTCEHCVRSVTEEITKIDTVSDVSVDLSSGAVSVRSSAALSEDDVREAVEEAGYELAS
ncbi:heavy-metal-associated domain-containing protein [Saccharopolyspora hirsuta]|uniref:Heavy-metal-associated domain-containing protein n=1 Tax=Saccharopolyspora hirsuta TaxID=1837 RepID=A0A5M7C703_SACHI|nr:heavy-metal-associated domain-containing protein [Saccharopolyspora hirsuta]KAA5838086.1 heavy-metal-associated domain-containing protein [Saccharopolyspora hirsuta]